MTTQYLIGRAIIGKISVSHAVSPVFDAGEDEELKEAAETI
jgi:hypothetical protein